MAGLIKCYQWKCNDSWQASGRRRRTGGIVLASYSSCVSFLPGPYNENMHHVTLNHSRNYEIIPAGRQWAQSVPAFLRASYGYSFNAKPLKNLSVNVSTGRFVQWQSLNLWNSPWLPVGTPVACEVINARSEVTDSSQPSKESG